MFSFLERQQQLPLHADRLLGQRPLNAFNATLPGIVNQHSSRGERVYFVDINAALTLADIPDGLHLTAAGYDKIGHAFYDAILTLPIPEPNTFLLTLATCLVLPPRLRRR